MNRNNAQPQTHYSTMLPSVLQKMKKAKDQVQQLFSSPDSWADTLRNRGHSCITWQECYPPRLRYCEQEPCVETVSDPPMDVSSIHRIHNERLTYARHLRDQGHVCVAISGYPCVIEYCGQSVCTKERQMPNPFPQRPLICTRPDGTSFVCE